MDNRYALPLVLGILVLASAAWYVSSRVNREPVMEDRDSLTNPEQNGDGGRIIMPDPESGVEISNVYEDKIVYTMDMEQDADKYRADCESRGGEFNSCGTSCPPDAEVCIQVCAYTCELGGK